jgi:hypothetical protein
MKATIELNIRPFTVPGTVRIEPESESDTTTGVLQLADLAPSTLAGLCDAFREAVFKASGKHDPAVPLPRTGPLRSEPGIAFPGPGGNPVRLPMRITCEN